MFYTHFAHITDFTLNLERWRSGDRDAGATLIALAYDDLRRMARQFLRQERQGHTLQPTAVANEAFIRLLGSDPTAWQDRHHFFAIASRQMRHILIDHARQRQNSSHRLCRVELNEAHSRMRPIQEHAAQIEEALNSLEEICPRACRVFEYRFFMGLREKETAELLGISLSTLKRDWTFARAWVAKYI